MEIVLVTMLVVCLVNASFWCAHWRSGGRARALSSATGAALYGYMLVVNGPSVLRYSLMAVVAALVFAVLVTTSRETWRRIRIETTLVVAAAVLVIAIAYITSIPAGVRVALLGVMGVVTVAAIVVSFSRLMLAIRAEKQR